MSEMREVRQLRDENARLKRLVADLTLDKHILSESSEKKSEAGTAATAGNVDAGYVPNQHRAFMSAGAIHASGVVLEEHGAGSKRTCFAHSRHRPGAASVRLSADDRDAAA